MYDAPWLQSANDAVWSALAAILQDRNLKDVPSSLDRRAAPPAVWQAPDLLMAQTCGYPLRTFLRGRVRYVATPSYAWPCIERGRHCSVVIVAADSPIEEVAELRGQVVAVNGPDSNSGMNLLRALIAPHAAGRPFFARVLPTGAHLASMAAVAKGYAGVAAIDAITYGLAAHHRPELTEGLRVLAVSASTPGLPLITSLATNAAEIDVMRAALRDLIADPAAAEGLAMLGISGFEVLEESDYDSILDLEAQAIVQGYPVLA
ncbi:phosphate/phosphite/phosphonate ABC transporter substrate-binding protein [Arboricoccus pini]|nr:PhnD/SsuA/transferrin family substrate-binding protein [Arboricoccus pini]